MVMPLWDDNPLKLKCVPYVTWGLILANFAVFLLEVGMSDEMTNEIALGFGAIPSAVLHLNPLAIEVQHVAGKGMPAVLTLFTSLFLHGGFWHLFSNMIFLWVFGDNVEEATGPWRFLAFYLICGVFASLAHILVQPNANEPLIGASGAISAVVAAYAMLRPCAKITVLFFGFVARVSAYWVIGAFVVLQLYRLVSSPGDDVAYWAHIGGLAAGAMLFPLMKQPHVTLFQCLDPNLAPVEPPLRSPHHTG